MRMSALCLLLSACDDPLYGVPLGEQAAVEEPNYEEHIRPFFERSCGAGCHSSGSASGGLDLDQGYEALLNAQAQGAPLQALVVPDDPDSSYLWLKVQGRQSEVQGSGSAMPLGVALSSSDEDTLYNWINTGAPETGAQELE